MARKKEQWYQDTEKLLYSYKSIPIRIMGLVQQLEILREQMAPSMIRSYELREGKNYSVSSPVENAVINRLENEKVRRIEQEIKNLENQKKIIELSLERMFDDEERQIIDLTYIKKKSWQYVCSDLGIKGMEKDTYYRKRKNMIHKMAWCLGYLPEDIEHPLTLANDG